MKSRIRFSVTRQGLFCLALVSLLSTACNDASAQASLVLDLGKKGPAVSPALYGLMTEEINYSYDGGIYAELVRNRSFKDNPKSADHWSVLKSSSSPDSIQLDHRYPLNSALPVSGLLAVTQDAGVEGIANEGYWGIPIYPATAYQLSFYARADQPGAALRASLESRDGATQYAVAAVSLQDTGWKQYQCTLTTAGGLLPSSSARLVIRPQANGSYRFTLVSLFPPTYQDRVNGNRRDIMELLAGMHPRFLRFPGGNYLEGQMFSTRFNWKETIGPLALRPGHMGPWGYRSSDGLGLPEFLNWCEDLHMEPLLAVFAGYTLNRDYLDSGALLQPFVQEALDEIEYVTGSTSTPWGAQRARDGHPAPYPLRYVEIGNEDGFDMSGSYARRYLQFYDAIHARYPALQLICTVGGKDFLGRRVAAPARSVDIVDEHYYRNAWEMEEDAGHYDRYDRYGPKVFVGEWATREGSPTPNFNAALGDAAWLTGLERNSDIVIMHCYAPLFVNVNPGGMQWRSDLIGYNALAAYGSPSYYVQSMFSASMGTEVVDINATAVPTQPMPLTHQDSVAGRAIGKLIPSLFYVAMRNRALQKVFIKIVNTGAAAASVSFTLDNAKKIRSAGTLTRLSATEPGATNSMEDPRHIVPVKETIRIPGQHFNRVFPPYSVSVVEIDGG